MKSKDTEIKNNLKEKRELIERIEKLEIGFLLLINQLRDIKEIPDSLLDIVEKILLREGEK